MSLLGSAVYARGMQMMNKLMLRKSELSNGFCFVDCKPMAQFGAKIGRSFGSDFVAAQRCQSCGYIGFQTPPESELNRYYSEEYGNDQSSWYDVDADYAPEKASYRADTVIDTMRKYDLNKDSVILEVGCAFGGTVAELRRRGFQAFGIDLSRNAINRGVDRGNNYIFCTDLDGLPKNDVENIGYVYSYHALEHIPQPAEFLGKLRNHLSPSAVLSFRVPNGSYYRAIFEGFETWEWFAYPDHLHLLTPRSLICLSDAAGYDLMSISTDRCGEPSTQLAERLKLSTRTSSVQAAYMSEEILRACNLLQELQFDLCVKNSVISDKFSEHVADARRLAIKNGEFESNLLNSVE
jgi:SAM-dependent methyltransferase